jgi:hypothetical protein
MNGMRGNGYGFCYFIVPASSFIVSAKAIAAEDDRNDDGTG